MRIWLVLAGLFGATGVGMAAYASHGLAADPLQPLAALGAQFQVLHALALLGLGALAQPRPGRLLTAAGLAFVVGILCFCGSLYARVFLGVPPLSTTPVGGVAFMAGWLLVSAHGVWPKRAAPHTAV